MKPGLIFCLLTFSLDIIAQCEWLRADLPSTISKANRISVSGDGSVYWQVDSLITKYSSVGDITWTKSVASGLKIQSISSATNGELYIAGTFTGTVTYGNYSFSSNGGSDLFVLKLNPDGQVSWKYNCGGNKDLICGGISADFAGNAVITGSFKDTMQVAGFPVIATHSYSNVYILKLTASGAIAWCRKNTSGFASGTFIKTDSLSNIYVVSAISRDTLFFDGLNVRGPDMGGAAALLVLDSTGVVKSLKHFYSTWYGHLKAFGYDRSRFLTIISADRYHDWIGIYDATGKRVGGAGGIDHSYSSGYEAVHVTANNIYALGWFGDYGSLCGKTYFGGEKVLFRFPRISNSCPSYHFIDKYIPNKSMLAGTDNEFYLTGFFSSSFRLMNCEVTNSTSNYYPFLGKLAGVTVNIPERQVQNVQDAFPNPAVDKINFNHLSIGSFVRIYNSLGELMIHHHVTDQNSFSVDVSPLNNGMYILETVDQGNTKSRKILVSK
jgi:hypothetical protein